MIIPEPAASFSYVEVLPNKFLYSVYDILVTATIDGITLSTMSDTSETVVAVETAVESNWLDLETAVASTALVPEPSDEPLNRYLCVMPNTDPDTRPNTKATHATFASLRPKLSPCLLSLR